MGRGGKLNIGYGQQNSFYTKTGCEFFRPNETEVKRENTSKFGAKKSNEADRREGHGYSTRHVLVNLISPSQNSNSFRHGQESPACNRSNAHTSSQGRIMWSCCSSLNRLGYLHVKHVSSNNTRPNSSAD